MTLSAMGDAETPAGGSVCIRYNPLVQAPGTRKETRIAYENQVEATMIQNSVVGQTHKTQHSIQIAVIFWGWGREASRHSSP